MNVSLKFKSVGGQEMNNMDKCIEAYGKGKIIQFWSSKVMGWKDLGREPIWSIHVSYRIKPEFISKLTTDDVKFLSEILEFDYEVPEVIIKDNEVWYHYHKQGLMHKPSINDIMAECKRWALTHSYFVDSRITKDGGYAFEREETGFGWTYRQPRSTWDGESEFDAVRGLCKWIYESLKGESHDTTKDERP